MATERQYAVEGVQIDEQLTAYEWAAEGVQFNESVVAAAASGYIWFNQCQECVVNTMIYIDVDAAVTVPVNTVPLTDDTDFKSRETTIAYNQAGMDLVWNFVTPNGTITQTAVTPTTAGDYDWTHIGDGMYKIEIPASGGVSINNDTEGVGYFTGVCTGVLPWRGPDIVFRAAGLNDKLIESPYDTTRGLSGTALPAAAADAAGGLPVSDAGGLDLDTMNSNVSAILTDTGTTIPATLTDMSGATFNTATDSLEAIRNRGDLSWITATTVDLNADQSGVTVGAVSGNVGGNVTGSVGSISGVTFPTNFSALVISAGGAVDSLVQGFLNNTIAETTADNISANFETFFDNGNALTSKIVNDVGVAGSGLTAQQVWEYNISAIATAGYAGTVLNARASQTSVDTIDGIVDAILADTGTDGVVIAAGQSVASVTGAVGSVTGNVGGSVASVTGAVGSVTGNVGGNVVGSVASVTGTVGGIAGTITTLDALDTAQDTQHSNTQSLITTVDAVVDGIQTDLDNGTDGLGAIKTAVDAISVSASPVLIQTTTIATLTSQTVFTLTAGSSDDDAYNGLTIVITDSATSTQKAVGTISDYVGSTKTVTLRVDPAIFTMAAGDTVSILAAVNGAVTGSATGVGWLG